MGLDSQNHADTKYTIPKYSQASLASESSAGERTRPYPDIKNRIL